VALEDDIAILGATPLLDELDRDALRLIAFSAERMRLAAGDVLFRQAAAADCGFVVISGSFTLSRGPGEATRTVGAGALMGELALLCDTTRPATAVADGPAEVYRIARGLFGRLLDEYPPLAGKLHRRLAARVSANAEALEAIRARLTK
jgi:CRP-like cAMP-binding protein